MSGVISPQMRGGKINVPSAAFPKGTQTGQAFQTHQGPGTPGAVTRGTGDTPGRIMSWRKEAPGPHDAPLPVSGSLSGSYLYRPI